MHDKFPPEILRDWTPMPAAEFCVELQRSHPQFQVTDLVGHGGMGAVYVGEDRQSTTRIAIKMLRPDALSDKVWLRRFDREIAVLRRLQHPNIVRIREAGETPDGYRFFVMDLLEGITLKDYLIEHPKPTLKRIAEIMADICAGVAHAHAANVVHRDLKAANVFILQPKGRAVVLDFGIARDLNSGSGTGSTSIVGTVGHIAWEVRNGDPASQVSDVFSLGVIFFQMLTGEIPDVGHKMPSDFAYDRKLDLIVRTALSQDPADRYQSASEFAQALKAAADSSVQTSPPREPASAAGNTGTYLVRASDERRDYLFRALRLWAREHSTGHRIEPSVPVASDEEWELVRQFDGFGDGFPSFEEIERTASRLDSYWEVTKWAFGAQVAVFFLLNWIWGKNSGPTDPHGSDGTLWQLGFLAYFIVGWLVLFLAGFGRFVETWIIQTFIWSSPVWSWSRPKGLWNKLNTENNEAFYYYHDLHPGPTQRGPQQVFWDSHEPGEMYITRDGRRLTKCSTMGYRGLSRGQVVHSKAGRVADIHFSDCNILVRRIEKPHWAAPDMAPNRESLIVYNKYGEIQAEMQFPRFELPGVLGRNQGNPLRPRHHGDILVFCEGAEARRLELRICNFGGNTGELKSIDELEKYVKSRVNLVNELRVAANDSVMSFAWHPSGDFLALEVRGWLHIVHWDTAALMASHGPGEGKVYRVRGWNDDGSLLAIDQRSYSLDRSGNRSFDRGIAACVWETQADCVREATRSERSWHRRARTVFDKFESCEGRRKFTSNVKAVAEWEIYRSEKDPLEVTGENNFNLRLSKVADLAWSPYDPNEFATVGGEDCPRDVRIWRRVSHS